MEARDFISEATSITESLKEEAAGLESVSVILKFMEEYPAFDFGTPGPLVHFVEKFYGRGYEAELLASIARKPTGHTVWLLNRVINGTKQPADRERMINALRQVEESSSVRYSSKASSSTLFATTFLCRDEFSKNTP